MYMYVSMHPHFTELRGILEKPQICFYLQPQLTQRSGRAERNIEKCTRSRNLIEFLCIISPHRFFIRIYVYTNNLYFPFYKPLHPALTFDCRHVETHFGGMADRELIIIFKKKNISHEWFDLMSKPQIYSLLEYFYWTASFFFSF